MSRYQDALDIIFSYVNHEKLARGPYAAAALNLSRMRELLGRLDDPQERLQCVHIAGTKGKGSTSAMVESVLRAAGFRTGLYTSPHLHTFRERIRVGGALMRKQELVDLLQAGLPAIEATPGVTAFEIMTALAFVHFARHEVEWAVLEVGLGGRLDATNVVHPAVCGITSLSYDHVELLGHSLSLIAWEKAGIIKAGVPVVSAPQEPEAMDVIGRACTDTGARLVAIGRDWTVAGAGPDPTGQRFTVRRTSDGLTLRDLSIRLLGRHQLTNATMAIAILAELNAQGVVIGAQALRDGLAAARWPGRFEVLQSSPAVIVDCAHNADSARKLRTALAEWFPSPPGRLPASAWQPQQPLRAEDRRLALVFGASHDKDIGGMLEAFLRPDPESGYRPADKVVVTRSGHPRSADPAGLADLVRGLEAHVPIDVHASVDDALTEALSWAGPDDLICITGSIFVVAQARRAWRWRHPEAFQAGDWVFQDETAGQVVPDDDSSPADPWRPTTDDFPEVL